MQIAKPTIDSAVAGIVKAAKQLEAVIAQEEKTATRAQHEKAKLETNIKTAFENVERAARIKAKLEDLLK